MRPNTIKTAKGLLLGVAFGAMSLGIMAQPVEAERNPCDLLQRELNARGTHGREVEPWMNLIACGDDWDTGIWRKDATNPCQSLAYALAIRFSRDGDLLDNLTEIEDRVDNPRCILEEDWAWSFVS